MQEPPSGTLPLLELSFYGRKLKNMDFFSKSDPFIVVYVGNQTSRTVDEFHLVGRTETVWDNLNPDFVTKFYLPFATEEDQNARILLECYDQDSKDNEIVSQDYLKRQDFIGQVTFNVFELMEVDHRLLSIQMCNRKGSPDKRSGLAIITAEEIRNRASAIRYAVEFRFTADCEMPRRKKIFVVLSRIIKYPSSLGPKWTPVYRTGALEPPQKSGQEFSFQDFSLVGEQLNALEDDRNLRLELYIFKKSGAHVLQAHVDFSIDELKRVESDYMFSLKPTKESSLVSGSVFQPGSMVTTDSAALGIPSSLRFYFTRLTWKNRL